MESTPKISEKELKKQNVVDSPERHVMDSIMYEPPSHWTTGKEFIITDPRATRGAWLVEPFVEPDSLVGKKAVVMSVDTITSVTDRSEIRIVMRVPTAECILEFRTGLTPAQWRDAQTYTVSHLVELGLVRDAERRLKGKKFYILPSRRLGSQGVDTLGTRYQLVTITAVTPATESSPLRVYFIDDENHTSSVLMSVGNATTARRNFETLFALTDPRLKYKNITDDTWQLIRKSKLRIGMTTEEARLALGAPDTYRQIPTHGGMVEQWGYMNGVYLVFEDGELTRFRQ